MSLNTSPSDRPPAPPLPLLGAGGVSASNSKAFTQPAAQTADVRCAAAGDPRPVRPPGSGRPPAGDRTHSLATLLSRLPPDPTEEDAHALSGERRTEPTRRPSLSLLGLVLAELGPKVSYHHHCRRRSRRHPRQLGTFSRHLFSLRGQREMQYKYCINGTQMWRMVLCCQVEMRPCRSLFSRALQHSGTGRFSERAWRTRLTL